MLRVRDLQLILSKFTDGQKGTISDCEVFLEMEDGRLAQISNIELQESRMIGKINSSAAWRVVFKAERKGLILLQSTTYKK